ncbi:DnaJ domain-containing protein [Waterburya agarophytonicola K14]|uniref:DnaJ domain-containing protein n=1 Tax=Waterburya agarophytonicola KI4 TaxID=2874699 RepID=A0A964FJ35_9CYAN|nr:DnaJ domain-containing protein [Waterburya agarophytonicola]MCC0178889.1 DnaJ domain-containing protein [Waterburya agarophytonicola KI4]
MSFAIKHGLFKLNLIDHHAILGVSLDANPKQIRLNYLKIAQKLHPDKCRQDPQKMEISSEILSRLVNPAYEQLSRKSSFAEHQLVLTQIGKRLAENKSKINVNSAAAQELLKAGVSSELVYPKLLKKLTEEQYKSLEKIQHNIGLISELNLIYLMLKFDRATSTAPQNKVAQSSAKSTPKPTAKPKTSKDKQTISQSKPAITKTSPPQNTNTIDEPTPGVRVNAFVGRAQQYIKKGEFDLAVTELRDALRIDPNHGVAHAVMGQAYLHKKQLTMAKVHIGKACKAEPTNSVVMESKKTLDKLMTKANKSKSSNATSNNKPDQSGFFSGFFGSKKK